MTREEFEDKLKNGTFSEDELKDVRWGDLDIEEEFYNDFKIVDTIEDPDLDRWSRPVSVIFNYKDKFYELNYSEGLTEYQDDLYYGQPYEVKCIEKQVIVKDYIKVED